MNETMFTQFMLLPEALQLMVVQHIAAGDLANFAQASKYTNDFVKRHALWEYRLEHDFFNGNKCKLPAKVKTAQHYYQSLCSELKKDVEELINLDAMKPKIFDSLRSIVAKPEGRYADEMKIQAEELLNCLDSIKNWNRLPIKERNNNVATVNYAYGKLIRGLSHGQLPYSRPIITKFVKLIIEYKYLRTLKRVLSSYKDEEILSVLKERNHELFHRLIGLNEYGLVKEIFSREIFSAEHPHRLDALMANGHDALSISSKSDKTELFSHILNSYPTLGDRHDALRYSNHSVLRNASANAIEILLQESHYKSNPQNIDAALRSSNHFALCKSVEDGDFARINLLIKSYSTQATFNRGMLRIKPLSIMINYKHELSAKYIPYTVSESLIFAIATSVGFLFLLPAVIAFCVGFADIRRIGLFISSFSLGASIASNRVFEEVLEDAHVTPISFETYKRLLLGTPGFLLGFSVSIAISIPIMIYNVVRQILLSIQQGFLDFAHLSTGEDNNRTWRQRALGFIGYLAGAFLGAIAGYVIISFDYINTLNGQRSSDSMTVAIEPQTLHLMDNSTRSIVSINEAGSTSVIQDCSVSQTTAAANKL
jgi:hypothetical protein